MNYYDELILQIEDLINGGKEDEALRLIQNELSLPYVPRETENRLKELKIQLEGRKPTQNFLTMEQIEEYLGERRRGIPRRKDQ